RAEKHVAASKPRFEANRDSHQRLLAAFLAAVARGDIEAISSVLADDVVLYGDNAGKERGAILRPILGRDNVARFFAKRVTKVPNPHALDVQIADVNGWPAIVARRDGSVSFVINIET